MSIAVYVKVIKIFTLCLESVCSLYHQMAHITPICCFSVLQIWNIRPGLKTNISTYHTSSNI